MAGIASVDSFIATRVLPEYRAVATRVVALLRECAPGASEGIGRGIPTWKGRKGLAVVNPTRKGITLAFSKGARFEDPFGLLEGVGKVSRNVRMAGPDTLNEAAIRFYIAQALRLDAETDG